MDTKTPTQLETPFVPTPVKELNRKERRNRIKYFEKMLKQHLKRRPKVNIKDLPEEEVREQTTRVNVWISRYGVLLRKLRELHGIK